MRLLLLLRCALACPRPLPALPSFAFGSTKPGSRNLKFLAGRFRRECFRKLSPKLHHQLPQACACRKLAASPDPGNLRNHLAIVVQTVLRVWVYSYRIRWVSATLFHGCCRVRKSERRIVQQRHLPCLCYTSRCRGVPAR